MKKILCLLLTLSLMLGLTGVVASAASVNDKMETAILEAMPDEYEDVYYPQIEKILNQITLTEDQYDALVEILDETVATVDLTQGHSLHHYSASEREYLLGQFDKVVDILDLSYTMTTKEQGDVVVHVFDADGVELGTLDGDLEPTKTGNAVSGWTWALIAAAVVVLAGGAVVFARKRQAE